MKHVQFHHHDVNNTSLGGQDESAILRPELVQVENPTPFVPSTNEELTEGKILNIADHFSLLPKLVSQAGHSELTRSVSHRLPVVLIRKIVVEII